MMLRRTWLIGMASWLAIACSLSHDAQAQQGWKAGVGVINITPSEGVWMAGYASRDHPAEGKLTDLFAKALILEDAKGERAVLISLDLIGVDRELSQSICERLRQLYGFQREQIAICCSHTHSGPVVKRNLNPMHYQQFDALQQRRIEQYARELEQQVIAAVGAALTDLAPSQLSWGNGNAEFAVNRRNNPQNEVRRLRREGTLKGPFDHDVPVLAVQDESKQLKAVVFGYACHATVLSSYRWCGDYPGYAQRALEHDHPGAVAMFWAGCGADQNPLPRRSVALAMQYGAQLADAVNVTLDGELTPVAPVLNASYQETPLPLASLPTRGQLENDAKSSNKYEAARAKTLLRQLDAGEPLSATYPYPVGVWRLGDEIQFVILGGEVVVDFALRLKAELRGSSTWVAGYANDVMAYIASRRVLAEGGYEGATAMVYYGLPSPWAPESEDIIIDAVHAQLPRQ